VAGGWLDLLAEPDADATEALGYLGLVAEELGAAGLTVPLIGTAVVWPSLFGGSAGGRRVAVAVDPVADDGDPLLAEDGVGSEVLVAFGTDAAVAHQVAASSPAGSLDGDHLGWVTPEAAVLERCVDPARAAEALRRGAALAAAEMAGALRQVSSLTVTHVTSREQFGRPVAAFQAVAHGTAHLATLVEAATWGARLACRSADPADTHAAKGWISQAAQEASALAHQLHGAIGFTEEYGLQRLTKRLRALRFAYGDDRAHREALGALRRV
jgi:acyl-CoA dehydrogenase